MNVDGVVVTDEPTNRYNCLAWTLGITTSWVWPWGSRIPTKLEFDDFYRSQGYSPAVAGPIAAFGLDLNSMTHASISGPGHGPRWESKAGTWLRFQHGLDEMSGGSLDGEVLGFYEHLGSIPSQSRQASLGPHPLMRIRAMQEVIDLTPDQLEYVHRRAAEVDIALRRRFEREYAAWKSTWGHPTIAVSSAPTARAQSAEYVELIALGPEILPLLMEKLTDPAEFFALVAVDRLAGPELHVSHKVDDASVLLGEQGRAIETVQRWVQSES
jgi:hypothetical protein